jgi:Putative DNA-binding domain
MTVNVGERELLARMKNFEDHFVERKTSSDGKDWLKTIVAFANSTPIDSYSVLFIGVRDSGEIEPAGADLDKLQRRLNQQIGGIQPPIQCIQQIVSENGRQALAVIVPYSPRRPHFSGPAFIRRGSESVPATSDELTQMGQSRDPKVARILAHKGEHICVMNSLATPHGPYETYWTGTPYIHDCNESYVTIGNGADPRDRQDFPLAQVDVGTNHQTNQFKITIHRNRT